MWVDKTKHNVSWMRHAICLCKVLHFSILNVLYQAFDNAMILEILEVKNRLLGIVKGNYQ